MTRVPRWALSLACGTYIAYAGGCARPRPLLVEPDEDAATPWCVSAVVQDEDGVDHPALFCTDDAAFCKRSRDGAVRAASGRLARLVMSGKLVQVGECR